MKLVGGKATQVKWSRQTGASETPLIGSSYSSTMFSALKKITGENLIDFPAYSDTALVTVTPRLQWQFWQFPNGLLYIRNDVVRVTLAYSDTCCWSRGCHCKRGCLYLSLCTCSSTELGDNGSLFKAFQLPIWLTIAGRALYLWSQTAAAGKLGH